MKYLIIALCCTLAATASFLLASQPSEPPARGQSTELPAATKKIGALPAETPAPTGQPESLQELDEIRRHALPVITQRVNAVLRESHIETARFSRALRPAYVPVTVDLAATPPPGSRDRLVFVVASAGGDSFFSRTWDRNGYYDMRTGKVYLATIRFGAAAHAAATEYQVLPATEGEPSLILLTPRT